MALLEIDGLKKTYPTGEQALRGIDLAVEGGEMVAILGLSGSGKSTLLRCINRLVEPTEGEARVLRMYYGLDGQEGMTLEEIGTYVGRTRERVRQIKEKALQKLRHPNRSEILKEYYGENA